VQQIWLDCSYLESFLLHSQGIFHLWAMTIPVAPFLAEGLWIRFVCILLVCWLVKILWGWTGVLTSLTIPRPNPAGEEVPGTGMVKYWTLFVWWSIFFKRTIFMRVVWLHRTKLKMKKKHSPW
jgi:hypothetical protein